MFTSSFKEGVEPLVLPPPDDKTFEEPPSMVRMYSIIIKKKKIVFLKQKYISFNGFIISEF